MVHMFRLIPGGTPASPAITNAEGESALVMAASKTAAGKRAAERVRKGGREAGLRKARLLQRAHLVLRSTFFRKGNADLWQQGGPDATHHDAGERRVQAAAAGGA